MEETDVGPPSIVELLLHCSLANQLVSSVVSDWVSLAVVNVGKALWEVLTHPFSRKLLS